MKLIETAKKIHDKLLVIFALLFVCLMFGGPVILPAVVASRYSATPLILIVLAAIVYLFLWFLALVLTLDAVAYIYGFHRPFFRSFGWAFVLREPNIRTPIDLIATSLFSYALTLYGFAVTYLFLSHKNPEAFNPNEPLDFLSAIYFTIVTAATVGYGDIEPVSQAARLIVTLQIAISFLYLIFIFSTITGLSNSQSRNPK